MSIRFHRGLGYTSFVIDAMICGYGEPVRLDRFIHPRVESEIAFLLAPDVGPPATVISGAGRLPMSSSARWTYSIRVTKASSSPRPTRWPTTPVRVASIWAQSRGDPTRRRICGSSVVSCGPAVTS
jgi:hypothetical protein